MAFDQHANFAKTTVAVAPSPGISGLSLSVTDASEFPAVPFNCTVGSGDPTTSEIVRVTNIAGVVFTILRAQEGTTARNIQAGDIIENSVSVKMFTDIEAQAIPLHGSGSPEGVITADIGRVYWDTTGKVFYVKDSGSGATGWYQLVGG